LDSNKYIFNRLKHFLDLLLPGSYSLGIGAYGRRESKRLDSEQLQR
jgi:hypothetical protein